MEIASRGQEIYSPHPNLIDTRFCPQDTAKTVLDTLIDTSLAREVILPYKAEYIDDPRP